MEKACLKVSIVTIIVNFVLSIVKFLAGIFGNSSAMISDSIHSLSDVLSTFIVIVGIKLASKKSDEKHQYGHERLENVASLILAFLLFYDMISAIQDLKEDFHENHLHRHQPRRSRR